MIFAYRCADHSRWPGSGLRQSGQPIRDALGGLGLSLRSGGCGHRGQMCRIGKQAGERAEQPAG
jgi:hypothetical protein